VSDFSAPPPVAPAPPSGGSGLKIPILFGAVIALLAASVYLFIQVDKLRTDLTNTREALLTEITNVKQSSSVTTATARRNLDSLRDELEAARRQAAMAAGAAKIAAQKHADDLAVRLAAEQKKQEQALKAELGEVKEAATVTSTKVGEVSTEVGTVKTAVALTRTDLEKTIADLKRVTGDLGVQSGLVATNSKELGALKALGERNYFEFNLARSKQPQKIGDITMLLKRTDIKRNKYTVDVVADDKMVEKKDKSINEPVQFYVSKARQPYEIVVNEVKKDRIVGYLSTPKVQTSR
jgi:hypothetical protein